ncbi:lysylphosphatidylglycerol synthase domain-containing protein [Albibacterium indicum]|uniref:lysylphosphatidylglycerol synthase domain-containing protein n=1 Tax=Albibacterium indicum TaxID=2292082 RepID=UPI001FE73F73|nr:lysylphosphatidylglycerol synthase domain-containing protein [Pedobacter indicus]
MNNNRKDLNPSLKKTLSYLLKAGIFILVVWYSYKLLTRNDALRDFRELIQSVPPTTIWLTISAVFLFMLVNWFFEALKWRYICCQFQPIRLRMAIESVLCGLSWAVFTPNRIGEYGGRVLFLRPRKRVFGVIGMLIGAVSQMVITNVLGCIAICWFVGRFMDIEGWLYAVICLFGFIYILFFLLLYFNISLINRWLLKIRFLRKYKRFFDLLLRYEKKELRKIFLYSVARFIIFTLQYCILIAVLLPSIPAVQMVLLIFILFFVQSALPSLDLFDVGVRGITASYFFGFVTDQIVAVMAITACVWFVNLIIPAIIGSFFVFKINFFGTRDH